MARTAGTDLIQRLSEGSLEVAPSAYLSKTRTDVSLAMEELLEVGARIRPLLSGGKRVGWVRGFHLSERKALRRWVTDEMEFIDCLLSLTTTLTLDEIHDLSMVELRSITRVVRAKGDSDLKLYPFISAFVTTGVSEMLWYSRGIELSRFQERVVVLPDGKRMRVSASSNQARLWATLCSYRVQSKARVEASMNAVLTIRPHVGKGADLKLTARGLQTDTLEAWRGTVHVTAKINIDGGWAHSIGLARSTMSRRTSAMASCVRRWSAASSSSPCLLSVRASCQRPVRPTRA